MHVSLLVISGEMVQLVICIQYHEFGRKKRRGHVQSIAFILVNFLEKLAENRLARISQDFPEGAVPTQKVSSLTYYLAIFP